ncbi:glucosamine kinase [Aliiroseovarius halocynthiae]|uniref:ATPase n=1 Tax=Aliiroseovarius halocynthiae TaxID=985055 RepID=A0A545SQB9_9RHOB|nr:BadF/BadG/BcrA/BcrD ATPase family protein [Aliiroseovarius halocynthiae]TQV67175.1 ATPase [Aliiroseovarius halocynthiae]SMR82094.1 glucosamine kinase [Aliiroseovarius halocynthiae]
MNQSSTHISNPVVAIDGGGTRCRLALRNGIVDTIVETGSANVTTNFDAAIAEMTRGLTQLSAQSGWDMDALSQLPAYAGLAGVAGSDMADRVAQALPFARMRVQDDRPSALTGALGNQDGVVAHCGTGSFIAAQIDGNHRFAGGWGPVLGDPASAQWVGRRALTLTLDAVDGIREHSDLSRHFLETFKGSAGIVAFAAPARPVDFGALAPTITAYAEQGDALALQVMQDAVKVITDLLPVLGWTPDMALCLTGGIAPQYAPYLPARMQACIIPPAGEPLTGALLLAQSFAGEITHAHL